MFNVGDVVKFKIGGPTMVVTFVFNNGKVACQWFTDDGKHNEIAVHHSVLTLTE